MYYLPLRLSSFCSRLDILINNAAIGCRTTILTTKDMEIFDDVFRIDVRGVYNLTRLLAPALIETKGNIVNISSIGGTVVNVGSLPYGMAKVKAVARCSHVLDLLRAPLNVAARAGLYYALHIQRMLTTFTRLSIHLVIRWCSGHDSRTLQFLRAFIFCAMSPAHKFSVYPLCNV